MKKDKFNKTFNLHKQLYKKEQEKYSKEIAPLKRQQEKEQEHEVVFYKILESFRKSLQDGLNVLQGLYLKEKKEAKQEYDKAKIYSEKHAVDMQEQIQKGIVVNSKNAGNDIYNGTSNSQNYYAFKAKDLEASIDYLTNSTNELNERTKVLNKEIESCNTEGEIEEKIDDIANELQNLFNELGYEGIGRGNHDLEYNLRIQNIQRAK